MTVDENHRGTTPDVVVDETHGRSHTQEGRAEDPYGWRVRIADREPRELDV